MLCPEVDPPPYGQTVYSNPHPSQRRPGDVIQYSCSTGYTLDGAESALCQRDGTWSKPAPTCLLGRG